MEDDDTAGLELSWPFPAPPPGSHAAAAAAASVGNATLAMAITEGSHEASSSGAGYGVRLRSRPFADVVVTLTPAHDPTARWLANGNASEAFTVRECARGCGGKGGKGYGGKERLLLLLLLLLLAFTFVTVVVVIVGFCCCPHSSQVSPAFLVFTPQTWDTYQRASILVTDDAVARPAPSFWVAVAHGLRSNYEDNLKYVTAKRLRAYIGPIHFPTKHPQWIYIQ